MCILDTIVTLEIMMCMEEESTEEERINSAGDGDLGKEKAKKQNCLKLWQHPLCSAQ